MKAIAVWIGAALCFLAVALKQGHGGILIAVGLGLINLGLLVRICCGRK